MLGLSGCGAGPVRPQTGGLGHVDVARLGTDNQSVADGLGDARSPNGRDVPQRQ